MFKRFGLWILFGFGILVFGFMVGCADQTNVPEVLTITSRTPASGATDVSSTESLIATFKYPVNSSGITAANFLTDYAEYGSGHTAGVPTIASLSWSNENKTITIGISDWSNIVSAGIKAVSTASKEVEIVAQSGKIKDIFNNIFSGTLWSYSIGYTPTTTTTTTTTTTSTTTTTLSWVAQNSGTTNNLASVCFANEDTGWIVGGVGGFLSKSIDGGESWAPQALGGFFPGSFFAVCCININNAWAAGDMSNIFATNDGGATAWQKIVIAGDGKDLKGISFVGTVGWAVGRQGTIYQSVDSGQTWKLQTSGVLVDLLAVSAVDATHAWAVGPQGTMIRTIDGTNWTACSATPNDVLSVHFINTLTGWAVGVEGLIFFTVDGGDNWEKADSGVAEILQGVFFVDANNGWVVGAGGTILHTSDGGNNWVAQTSGTAKNLSSVYFTDISHGWIVGNGGTLLKYE